jgi:hypothetical protein
MADRQKCWKNAIFEFFSSLAAFFALPQAIIARFCRNTIFQKNITYHIDFIDFLLTDKPIMVVLKLRKTTKNKKEKK